MSEDWSPFEGGPPTEEDMRQLRWTVRKVREWAPIVDGGVTLVKGGKLIAGIVAVMAGIGAVAAWIVNSGMVQ